MDNSALMKQLTFLEPEEGGQQKYTTSPGSPVYVPKERRPHIAELRDSSRCLALLRAIEASDVTADQKRFLSEAASRHTVFNYELIADYYAHATPEMQRLMEASALVIVDVDQAIERGYVQLCDSIRGMFLEQFDA